MAIAIEVIASRSSQWTEPGNICMCNTFTSIIIETYKFIPMAPILIQHHRALVFFSFLYL